MQLILMADAKGRLDERLPEPALLKVNRGRINAFSCAVLGHRLSLSHFHNG